MEPLREIDDTFCIAVLGDFLGTPSGAPGGGEASWTVRRATPDTVLKLLGLRPTLRVPNPGDGRLQEIPLSNLDGFQPEDLFRRLDLFGPLRQAREEAREGKPSPPPPSSSAGSLLDTILDVAQPQAQEGLPRTREELDDFVRAAVRPHLVRPDTDAPGRVARVDEAASSLMSSLLHDPAFQEVESLWRSLVFLLSRVDTYGKVRVYAVHLPREELDRDLTGPAGHPGSRLHGLLARPDLGAPARRWSLAVGAYTFGAGPRDLELLARIAAVARATGIPWVSSFHAAPSGPGSEPGPGAFPEEWAAFRRRPEASWLGLTYPRFLVREPFGAARRSSRPFDFQERVSSREDLLWGHGAFLCAALMGQGYAARGWGFRAEDWLEMEGMPQASPGVGGESTPLSTEATLDLGMANRLMEAGIITLLPFPTRAAVRLGGIPSVSAGGAPLSGWWRR